MDEHRSKDRRRKLQAGKAILSKSTIIDCTIRDLSETGARLEFSGPTQLPKEFVLRVAMTGAQAPVELMWQRGLSAGVRFDAPLH
jgi:hypothetical protein